MPRNEPPEYRSVVKAAELRHPDKKNSFYFLGRPTLIQGIHTEYDIVRTNKQLIEKIEINPQFITPFSEPLTKCQNKKEHNKLKDDELIEFASALPRNVVMDEGGFEKFYHRMKIHDRTVYVIGPCIDIECSGVNKDNEPAFCVFSSLLEMKKHYKRTQYEGCKGSMLLVDFPEDYLVFKNKVSGDTLTFLRKNRKD